MNENTFKKYFLQASLIVALACAPVLVFNTLIDPLWHFNGNLLTGTNYSIDERTSKINLFLKRKVEYNCVIFGSSRTTLLQTGDIKNWRCFNLAFSSGKIEEFIAFAHYLRTLNFSPELVIIGVDGFNFISEETEKPDIPKFITDRTNPSNFVQDYLSFDALQISWRTFRDDYKPGRYYDRNFDCRFDPRAPRYDPFGPSTTEGIERKDASRLRESPYSSRKTALYLELSRIFPNAITRAYIPPLSLWRITELAETGVLESYVETMYEVSRKIDGLLDFSVPSEETARIDNTFDGSHYSERVNGMIANRLEGAPTADFGIDVSKVSREEYKEIYRTSILRYSNSLSHRRSETGDRESFATTHETMPPKNRAHF